MKALTKRFDRVLKDGQAVEKWLKMSETAIEVGVKKVLVTEYASIGIFVAFGSLLFLLMTFAWMNEVLLQPKPWPAIGWFFLATLSGGLVSALALGIWESYKQRLLREAKRRELEAERAANPLFERAKLILEALRDYRIHCDKYRAWSDAVDERLIAGDEELAGRYHQFLASANITLQQAIDNFLVAAELHERRLSYEKEHPELAGRTTGTALTELLSLLNQPLEATPGNLLTDPAASLAHEEALAELTNAFRDNELSKRIEALTAKGDG